MAKRAAYFAECERLYVIEQCTIAEIASRLRLGEKTVREWKAEGDWETKRKQYLTSKQSFHEELYEFSRDLLRSIREDMKSGTKVDAGRLYTLSKLLPNMIKVKDYEAVKQASEKAGEKQEGLSEDVIDAMKEFLGTK